MQKTFCDRCKKETTDICSLTNDAIVAVPPRKKWEQCQNCFDDFKLGLEPFGSKATGGNLTVSNEVVGGTIIANGLRSVEPRVPVED